jgi:nucleotide sugar dehydrogenase
MPHFPGCGVGGHCIPVDPYYLIEYAKHAGQFDHKFLSLACKTNEMMPAFTVELLGKELAKKKRKLDQSTVAVLGLAYKANIGDRRESPSYAIIKELKKKDATVTTFDPYVSSNYSSLDDALDGVDAVIVATGHQEFIDLSPHYFQEKGIDVVIDGRNCLDKEKFFQSKITYKGIGR